MATVRIDGWVVWAGSTTAWWHIRINTHDAAVLASRIGDTLPDEPAQWQAVCDKLEEALRVARARAKSTPRPGTWSLT